MSVKDATYKLLKLLEKRRVVSKETIHTELSTMDSGFIGGVIDNCCQLGYIVNIPVHKGYHQIGTLNSNQYQITFSGLSYVEQYEQNRSQQYWNVATTIITAIILPIVLAIYAKLK